MMTVIGTRITSFTASDGNKVDGTNFYVNYQQDGVTGLAAERIFISSEKLRTFPFVPMVGDTVQPTYNRYGKVDLFTKVKEPPTFPNEQLKPNK